MLSVLPLTFTTIVEVGSITKAADQLNLAKSAVSQNLKRLEERLSVKLITRTTRQLSLTPAGERYYRRCKEMLTLANLASTEMEDFGACPAGPIRVTAPHSLVGPILAPAIYQITQRFPKLKPEVIADDSRLDLVASGIDLAISVGKLPDSNLKAKKVGVLRDILCASPHILHDIPHNSEQANDWLQQLPYIAHFREGMTTTHELSSKKNKKTFRLKFQTMLKCNTIEAQINFARKGLGIALLPDLAIANDLRNGQLVPLLSDGLTKPIAIYAVHTYGTLPPLSVLELIKAVKDSLAQVQFDSES
ncbi:MAG: LysR family transcriptional regulator [Cellvibrionaceae bacterium]